MKKLKLNMDKLYGNNIESVKSEFITQAKREGWNQIEIDEVLGETKQSRGYDEIFDVISKKCIKQESSIIDW